MPRTIGRLPLPRLDETFPIENLGPLFRFPANGEFVPPDAKGFGELLALAKGFGGFELFVFAFPNRPPELAVAGFPNGLLPLLPPNVLLFWLLLDAAPKRFVVPGDWFPPVFIANGWLPLPFEPDPPKIPPEGWELDGCELPKIPPPFDAAG